MSGACPINQSIHLHGRRRTSPVSRFHVCMVLFLLISNFLRVNGNIIKKYRTTSTKAKVSPTETLKTIEKTKIVRRSLLTPRSGGRRRLPTNTDGLHEDVNGCVSRWGYNFWEDPGRSDADEGCKSFGTATHSWCAKKKFWGGCKTTRTCYYNRWTCNRCADIYQLVLHSGRVTRCVDCPRGSRCDGTVTAHACAAGQIDNMNDRTACTNCVVGYYSNAQRTQCVACGQGRFGRVIGTADSETEDCPHCPMGWYQDGTAETSCKQCDGGKYSSSGGSTYCEQCPGG
jgi:hypothetical protein